MATLLINGDIWRVRVLCTAGAQISLNVLHVKISSVAGTPTDVDLRTKMDSVLSALYKPAMSNQATYRGVGVSRITPLPTSEITTISSLGAGTSVADLLPLQTCGIVGLYDGQRGRAHRGRIFLPFPSEALSGSDGHPTTGYLTLTAAFGGALTTTASVGSGLNTASADFGLYHRLPAPGSISLIQTYKNPQKWALQRRRGDYGAPNVPPF